ncbi:MAG: choice-of-anchor D domain-containing protein [Kofleriaceae bacterium]
MTARRALLVIAALAGASLAVAAPAPAVPARFHAEPEVLVIDADATDSATLQLRNSGATPVVATEIVADPGCESPDVSFTPTTGFTLAPGEAWPLLVSCLARTPGMARCTYQVHAATSVLLSFEAVCAHGANRTLAASVTEVNFGGVAIGTTAARSITLTNGGSAAPIDHLFFQTTDLAGNFAIAAPCNPDARECDAAIAPLAMSASTEVVVTCTPRTVGPQVGSLYVTTSGATHLVNDAIAMTCTGLAATAPVLAVSPTAIDLGTVEQLAASATTTVHLANAGTGTLSLLALQIVDSGTGAALDWSYAAHAPCTASIPATCPLEAGAAVDVDLTFDPSAIGVRDATLLVNYHDTADRSTSIPLHGIGRGATLELVGGVHALDFGSLPLNVTASLTFDVVNRGTRNLIDATVALTPAAPAFVVKPGAMPGPMFTVKPTVPTTIKVSCTPTVAGVVSSTLRVTAPDVTSEPITIALQCTGDPAMTVTATPPAVVLGEVRIGSQAMQSIAIASVAAPVALVSAALAMPDPRITLSALPPITPALLDLTAVPQSDAPLDNLLTITPATGPALELAISGTVVTAKYAVPAAISLGTFCVQQATTPRTVALASTGTATLGLSAPTLARADSPFDLELVAPLAYPAEIPALARALVTITPRRQTVAGMVADVLTWTTDADGTSATAQTLLSATFVDDGPAVAPTALAFPQTTIHLDRGKAQSVTLRNCSSSALQLDAPQIPAPFTIDSPSFPGVLMPGETATVSVGFHPTKAGPVMKDLVITSPQLRDTTFTVTLTGEGITDLGPGSGSGSGSGSVTLPHDSTSFYSCGSCASNDSSSLLAFGLAALCVLVPRRRRR